MKVKYVLVTIASLCLLCALLMTMPTSVLAAENLAINGDLEMGNSNGWKLNHATVAPAEFCDVHSGNYSLCLYAAADYAECALKSVPVGKNATVTVSFYYMYWGNGGSSDRFHVYTYKGADTSSGHYTGGADAALTHSPSWKKVSYTFNSGEYDHITLKFCPVGATKSCTIDDLVVTAVGGSVVEEAPYLTSFGTKYNRPKDRASNLIKNGSFESTAGAQWNTASFLGDQVQIKEDATAPEGSKSLYFTAGTTAAWYTFPVSVERNTLYTFSAWVKSPRLSANNRATATFGIADAETGEFLIYEPYTGATPGTATLSSPTMQLMATSPDGQWHLRSVTFYSGTATTVNVALYGAQSVLQLDDIALYKLANGVEYISELRSTYLDGEINTGAKYCADEDSLIPVPHMTGKAAEKHWSDNPAWRNGFLSMTQTGDSHDYVLKYTASSRPLKLTYIDWIDVLPETQYTLTLDVKVLAEGDGRIAMLDDNVLKPSEFYMVFFESDDGDWQTYSITFNSGPYSRIGFAIVDGGGEAYIDNTRLFRSDLGIEEAPEDQEVPVLQPVGCGTSVMEMEGYTAPVVLKNGDFEDGWFHSWDVYQSTDLTASAAHSGANGAQLKGNGSWDALLEQKNIPVTDGDTYTLSYWFKANTGGANITLMGATTGTKYAYAWAHSAEWTNVTATFTVEGDTALALNLCGGGNGVAENLFFDEVSLVNLNSGAPLGVAFLTELETAGVARNERQEVDLSTATVDPYGDHGAYRLVKMGAVLTNKASVGTDLNAFKVEHIDEIGRVIDVPVVYLYDVTKTTTTFAVRVIDIPHRYADAVVYARPYYVFEKEGEEITVYGDVYSRSYNNSSQDWELD